MPPRRRSARRSHPWTVGLALALTAGPKPTLPGQAPPPDELHDLRAAWIEHGAELLRDSPPATLPWGARRFSPGVADALRPAYPPRLVPLCDRAQRGREMADLRRHAPHGSRAKPKSHPEGN